MRLKGGKQGVNRVFGAKVFGCSDPYSNLEPVDNLLFCPKCGFREELQFNYYNCS